MKEVIFKKIKESNKDKYFGAGLWMEIRNINHKYEGEILGHVFSPGSFLVDIFEKKKSNENKK